MTFIVDASMYDGQHALPRDVYGDLDAVVRRDSRYHYSTPVCAHRWLAVCDDEAYGHRALVGRVTAALPSLITALEADRGRRGPIALVSLGPGDGAMDECMLRALDAEMDVESYVGLDFSFELLTRATHRLKHVTGWRRPFPIRAVCGDFHGVSGATLGAHSPETSRVFSLTGFTLGNYGEDELLAQIGRLMRPGDYLFLDARLHSLGALETLRELTAEESGAMTQGYDLQSVREFAFGPVEVATLATADSVRFRFDVRREMTAVPSGVNVVISCEGLDTSMRLTGERVCRERLELAVTTRYDAADLTAWIGAAGFLTVWGREVWGVGLYLLRRG